MSGLQITITPAGFAAIVNAENTGTDPVLLSHIGVSASAAGVVGGALSSEIKRLTTFSGLAVADNTIHVTLRDDSADVYSLRSFAFYLQDGTLFAWYAQAGVILEKSAQAMMLLAADVVFQQINAASITFGNTNWINPPATTTVQGVVELADNAEGIAGADGTRAMTPAADKATLDDRLGAGAPTGFVKSLLNLATAALFRGAIGLGNAATRNEGAGNNLDADKLDGQHGAYYLDWPSLTNKPATFPPSVHAHPWADINGAPSTATRWPAWGEVTDKPASFAPSAHTHAAADITAGTFDLARLPNLPYTKIPNLQADLDYRPSRIATALDIRQRINSGFYEANEPTGGYPADAAGWWHLLSCTHANTGNYYAMQFACAFGGVDLYFRSTGGDGNKTWMKVWNSGNFDPNTKANLSGAEFTGVLAVSSSGVGRVGLNPGNPTAPGYVFFTTVDGTRRAYIGWQSGNNIAFQAENGWGFEFNVAPKVAGNSVWHGGNFDPGAKANLSGATFTGSITVPNIQVGAAGNGTNAKIFVGDDALLTDVGEAHVMGIKSQTSAGVGFFRFGSNTWRFGWDGGNLVWGPNVVWHSGNFDPNSKANLSGANFTGAITAPTMQATSSDARLKTEIEDLRDCLKTVKQLRPRRWTWIDGGESDFGFIAQEHRDALPTAVHENDEGMLFVRYGKAEAMIVGALQELAARLDLIEARLSSPKTVR